MMARAGQAYAHVPEGQKPDGYRSYGEAHPLPFPARHSQVIPCTSNQGFLCTSDRGKLLPTIGRLGCHAACRPRQSLNSRVERRGLLTLRRSLIQGGPMHCAKRDALFEDYGSLVTPARRIGVGTEGRIRNRRVRQAPPGYRSDPA